MNETPEGTRDEDEATKKRTISGSFDITLNLTQSRGIKMSGYVYSDDTQKQINARIDVYQDALDRQAIRVDIQSKESQIAMHRINVDTIGEMSDALIAKKSSGKKLTSTETMNLGNMPAQLASAKQQIESLEAAIAAGRAKLAAT